MGSWLFKETITRLQFSCDRYLSNIAVYPIIYILCIAFCALYSVYCFLCIVFNALYSIHCILLIVFNELYSIHCIQCIVCLALYSMHFIICNVFYELHKYIAHFALYSMYCIYSYQCMQCILCMALNALYIFILHLLNNCIHLYLQSWSSDESKNLVSCRIVRFNIFIGNVLNIWIYLEYIAKFCQAPAQASADWLS